MVSVIAYDSLADHWHFANAKLDRFYVSHLFAVLFMRFHLACDSQTASFQTIAGVQSSGNQTNAHKQQYIEHIFIKKRKIFIEI